MRWRGLASLLTGLAACAGEPGELDPEVVDEITKKSGNALGFQRSGGYSATLEVVDCSGCTAILELGGQGTCTLGNGASFADQIQLVQTEGVLLLDWRDIYAVGPLDAGGAFAVGSVADLSNALADLHVVLRVDGAFDDEESTRFSGLVRQRTHGATTAGEVLDCYETFDIAAERVSPP